MVGYGFIWFGARLLEYEFCKEEFRSLKISDSRCRGLGFRV